MRFSKRGADVERLEATVRVVFAAAVALSTLLATFAAGGNTARADDLVVTNADSAGPGSFVDQLAIANERPGHDTISFAPDVRGRIFVDLDQTSVLDDLTIVGPGSDLLTLQRAAPFQRSRFQYSWFYAATESLAISGLTLDYDKLFFVGDDVALDDVVVHTIQASPFNNPIELSGGAEANSASTVVLSDVIVDGGGIAVADAALVDVRNVLVRGSDPGDSFGGLRIDGVAGLEVTIDGLAASDSRTGLAVNLPAGESDGLATSVDISNVLLAGHSFGLVLDGVDASVANTTITRASRYPVGLNGAGVSFDQLTLVGNAGERLINSAAGGSDASSFSLLRSTLACNDVDGPVFSAEISDVSIDHSIVTANGSAAFAAGLNAEFSVLPVGSGFGGTNIESDEPRLVATGSATDPPFALRPAASSPVVDAGDPVAVVVPGDLDQVGAPRLAGSTIDIGAVEYQPVGLVGSVDDIDALVGNELSQARRLSVSPCVV